MSNSCFRYSGGNVTTTSSDVVGQIELHRLQTYLDASPTDRDVSVATSTYNSLRSLGSESALHLAGSMALDFATQETTSDHDRVEWFQKASESWSTTVKNASKIKNISLFAIQASLGVAQLPTYQCLTLGDSTPGSQLRTRLSDDLIIIAERVYQRHDLLIEQTNEDYNRITKLRRLAGVASELAVMMLHDRFTTTHLVDGSQIAVSSRLSEDRGPIRRPETHQNSAWDISVFQKLDDEPIEIPYKIQVKSKWGPTNHNYDPEISTICVREDLSSAPGNRGTGSTNPYHILKELISERNGSDIFTENLDLRTERLLDILG